MHNEIRQSKEVLEVATEPKPPKLPRLLLQQVAFGNRVRTLWIQRARQQEPHFWKLQSDLFASFDEFADTFAPDHPRSHEDYTFLLAHAKFGAQAASQLRTERVRIVFVQVHAFAPNEKALLWC